MSFALFLIAAGWLVYFWYSSLEARELATRVAIETCDRQDLQFLDGTVALRQLRLRRNLHGRLVFQRTYQFEYTDDQVTRRQGFVILLGPKVDSVGLAPAH
jgi:hypothetical protein